jgi:3-methylcrotonyl-CoA carboxylase beta subunit
MAGIAAQIGNAIGIKAASYSFNQPFELSFSKPSSYNLPFDRLSANGGLNMQVPRQPKFDAEELYGVIPDKVRAHYDVHEVIAHN